MGLIVQKFGGSSVADAECLRHVADIIIKQLDEGNRVVTVVSAQGDETDRLIEKAKEIAEVPAVRESDALLSTGEQAAAALLAITLIEKGANAISLNASQAGIHAEGEYGNGQITLIETKRILKYLSEGKTPVIAGFQAVDGRGDTVTLGRGGSDSTAVSLAAFLHADECRIYKDVDGIYTEDPHRDPEAQKYQKLSYRQMRSICERGSGVLQKNCVITAEKYGVRLQIYSSITGEAGTVIE